jgi:hypothetical protein
MRSIDLEQLETTAYRESYSDGVVDLFAGLSLIWIGACWLWFEAIAPFAAILPAVLIPTLVPIRRRLTESRAGYLRWTEPRRTWERRQLIGLAALGVGTLVVVGGLIAYRMLDDGAIDVSGFAAAIPAVLVAIPVVFFAVVTGLRRLWAYAFVIVATALATVAANQNPGWPLLVGGLAMLVTGIVLFAEFRRSTPTGDGA